MVPEAVTFSSSLRQATRVDHSEAESSEFIASLMEGKRSAADYVLLLTQYQVIYGTLERAVDARRAEPAVTELFDPALDRLASLESDLGLLKEWAGLADTSLPVVPATDRYAHRIAEVAAEADPARLLAHHYLRYLGDLSGGQAIGALVARHYGVPAEMLTMWSFPEIPKAKPYKDRYRELLDAFAQDHRGEGVVDEAALGFRLNREVFAELSGSSPLLAVA
ncbi:heme oxygenase (biliverdin-producing) [Arthrobacter sp. NPDC090010]|uniref:biliverdin-producing heme oxygenase n=1 Tax=Arthrobacter sp. NPDC090010 TaxID=3363942 RepID=UPI00381DD24E